MGFIRIGNCSIKVLSIFVIVSEWSTQLLVAAKRCMKPLSNKRSKKIIKQRYEINQKKISSVEQIITDKDLKDNSLILQKGKKVFLKIIFK